MSNHSDFLQLLALVPHRDVRGALRAWSASLFSAGLRGAWSFPWVMPIAALTRPLSAAELKSRALMMRRAIDLSGGKCAAGAPAVAALFDNFVFGSSVNIALSDSFFDLGDAVIGRVSPLVIGAAVGAAVGAACDAAALCRADAPPAAIGAACGAAVSPCLSFRAAALANMRFRPLPVSGGVANGVAGCVIQDFSFEWEIGKLHWLPKSPIPSPQLPGIDASSLL